MRRPMFLAALVFVLAACSDGGAEAPGGVSPGEAEALEEAAEMLDKRALPPQALPPEASPAQGTGDAAAQAGP